MAAKKCFDDQWIVVTGGASFIGSCVVRQLNDLGYDRNIIIVDDIARKDRWKNLSGKKFSEVISPHEFKGWLSENINDVEAIVHLAYSKNPDLLYQVHYRLTADLAALAIDYNIRFIYASTAETYGYGKAGFEDDHEALDSLRPQNSFGGVKHLFDLWALRNKCLDKVVGLKFADVYGPNDFHNECDGSAVLQAFLQEREKGEIDLTSLSNFDSCYAKPRDFVFVKDVARVVCEFLFNDASGIYNVGSGVSTTLLEMVDLVKMAMDSSAKIVVGDFQERMEEHNLCQLSMKKLRSVIDPPSTKIQDGIMDYVKNYLQREDLW